MKFEEESRSWGRSNSVRSFGWLPGPGAFHVRVAGVLALLGLAATAGEDLRWSGEDFASDFLASRPATDGQSLAGMPDLIRQLGDASYKKRQAAGQALAALGASARVPLEAAVRSADPEVAQRAGDLLAEIVRREKDRMLKKAPLLALSLPVFHRDYGRCLACLGTNPIQQNFAPYMLEIAMPSASGTTRPKELPFFLILGGRSWQPVPMWIGPRRVPVPDDDAQLPLRPALELGEYDLLTELDEQWQPTTPKAKARVQAVTHYLAAGGNVTDPWYSSNSTPGWIAAREQLLPAAPVPAWVAALRQRVAQGDANALRRLVSLRATPPAAELLQMLNTAQGAAVWPILDVLRHRDFKLAAVRTQALLNGHLANDAFLLEVLGEAGVLLDPAKLNYPASEFGSDRMDDSNAVLRYCRRMGLKVPDGLVDAWLSSSDLDISFADMVSGAQVDALKKMLKDQTRSARALFHARCLLLLSGDLSQEAELMKLFPPGTPYQTSYDSDTFDDDYCREKLSDLAAEGRFPSLARQLMRENLFECDKAKPELYSMLRLRMDPEVVTEVGRKLDEAAVKGLSWHLGYWRCRAAVPTMIRLLDAWSTEEQDSDGVAFLVVPLSHIADPAAGPCLVRAIEKIEKSGQHADLRLRALVGLLRMGADFQEGKQTLLRVSASEQRFSAFRMVALAGMARHAPAEGVPPLLRELEAAPPSGLPMFLKWAAVTRLPEVTAVLKKHLKHRYPPVAEAAALALLEQGDNSVLPFLHERRYWWRQNWDLARILLSCWREDTSAAEVKLIRETLDGIGYPARCASRAEWAKELENQSADY